jgi:SAM-dependent methyltransferase
MSTEVLSGKTAADAFAETMGAHLHGAAVTMMTAVGYRTGLFETLAHLPPSTPQEIAEAAGLHERYVREWLAAMTTARVVTYDASTGTYLLPDANAQSLTRAYGPRNLGTIAQLLTTLVKVEDALIDAFRNGSGVAYADFPRIDEAMSESTGPKLPLVLDPMLHLAPGLAERLRWGIDVLDLGCGEGRATLLLAQRFPRSRFLGVDLSGKAIGRAERDAIRLQSQNTEFEVRDAAAMADTARFDLVLTFDAIHDQAEPAKVLANIARALRPDGTYIMVEPDASSHLEGNLAHPLATLLYTISTFHCTTVSLAQNGAGLGTMWRREKALEMLHGAGFSGVHVERLADDPINAYFISTKG